MDTQITLAKKRGPKPSGVEKVVYYRRVTPEWVKQLDEYMGLSGGPRPVGFVPEVGQNAPIHKGEVEEVKKQLEDMTASYVAECDQVAALTLKVELLNAEFDTCLAMTEDDKVRYWRDRAFRAEAAIKAKGGEFDQTQ